jgi:hypothetical protein
MRQAARFGRQKIQIAGFVGGQRRRRRRRREV